MTDEQPPLTDEAETAAGAPSIAGERPATLPPPPAPASASGGATTATATPTPTPTPTPATGPVPAPPTVESGHPVRPGDLTTPWRAMLGLTWIGAFFAYAAVWQVSVQIGIGTWWVGPRAQPTAVWVRMIPFLLTVIMTLLVVYNIPRLVRASLVGAAIAAVIALPDFSRSIGLAVTELVIAAAIAIVSGAAATGRYRPLPDSAATSPTAVDSPG